MIWVAVLIMAFVAYLLAIRSMKDYQEEPKSHLTYQLFLLRTPQITSEFFAKLYVYCQAFNAHVSLERLFKGRESVLVIYAPINFIKSFPDLSPLPLEDYLKDPNSQALTPDKQIDINHSHAWSLTLKKTKGAIEKTFLENLDLKDTQHFFWQLVLMPIKTQDNHFQVTIRAIAAEQETQKRINLIKKIDNQIKEKTNLEKSKNKQPSKTIFNSYLKRTLVPKEVSKHILSTSELVSLL